MSVKVRKKRLSTGEDSLYLDCYQRILEHSKADMTMQYAKGTDTLKKQAINTLPGLELNKTNQGNSHA